MTHASTADSPLSWSAGAVAAQISDVLAENYYQPEGDLAGVGYEGPDPDGVHTLWVESPGSPVRIVVVVVPVADDSDRPVVQVTVEG